MKARHFLKAPKHQISHPPNQRIQAVRRVRAARLKAAKFKFRETTGVMNPMLLGANLSFINAPRIDAKHAGEEFSGIWL
jgi:hypothetical protein